MLETLTLDSNCSEEIIANLFIQVSAVNIQPKVGIQTEVGQPRMVTGKRDAQEDALFNVIYSTIAQQKHGALGRKAGKCEGKETTYCSFRDMVWNWRGSRSHAPQFSPPFLSRARLCDEQCLSP